MTLSGVGVLDTQAPPAGALTTGPTCMATTLAPNATTTCIATYTVLQTDMDNGSINDSAVASATSPTGTTITSDPAIATVTATQTAAIAIAKTANPTTVTGAGQHVTYTFKVTNTGNVTLSGVSVSDTPAPPAGNLNAAPACPLTTLAPGTAPTARPPTPSPSPTWTTDRSMTRPRVRHRTRRKAHQLRPLERIRHHRPDR